MPTKALYIIQVAHLDLYKIGISEDPLKRLGALQSSNPFPLRLIYTTRQFPGEEARFLEQRVQGELDLWNVRGEWFDCDFGAIADVLGANVEAVEAI